MSGRAPRRLSEVASVASRYGCTLESGGGKHSWRFTKPGKRPYTIPARNGLKTEIAWKYILGLCRNMDIPVSAFTD